MATHTLASVQQTMLDNADYSNPASVTKARLYVIACERYRILFPSASSGGGTSVAYDLNQISAMQAKAEAFIRANSSPSGRVKFLSVSDDFR